MLKEKEAEVGDSSCVSITSRTTNPEGKKNAGLLKKGH